EDQRHCIAIIGDGAMSAGMVFEALNHLGALKKNLIIILNDNDMSISPPVGALSNYFARTISSKLYTGFREGSKKILDRMPPIREFARRTEEHLKGMIAPGTLFEELGCNYLGPFDGHDLHTLLRTLRNVKDLSGPQLIHVITAKGKGYAPAEADSETYHAVKPGFYDIDQGIKAATSKIAPPSYSNIFGDWLCDIAAQDPKVMAITPAMLGGSDLIKFHQQFPDRCFDVGIAELAIKIVSGSCR
ncbi:MAG: 1-deoxy-D-xylulose-5-phosphate synthase, partial [Chitinophagia bacterium]|nr:1-deoxy-D-xylulose-5-phosphate synthase [Chitinophagia bacterium]